MTFTLEIRFLAFTVCLWVLTLVAGQQMAVDLQTGAVMSSNMSDSGFELLEKPPLTCCSGRCDLQALVKLSFDDTKHSYAHLELRFSENTSGVVFHVLDAKSKNFFGHDSATYSEVIFINKSIAIFDKEEYGPRKLLHLDDNVIRNALTLDIMDGNVFLNNGKRVLSLKSHKLFRVGAKSSPPDSSSGRDIFLGLNRPVDQRDGVKGEGLCFVRITWEACR